MKTGCSIVTATFNEVENVQPLIEEIYNKLKPSFSDFEIIVVDDNSPDGTFDKLLNLANDFDGLRPIVRKSDHGLAASIWDGIRATKFDNIVIMDADLSHQPSEIFEMIELLMRGYKMVWRSRYVTGGGVEHAIKSNIQFKLSKLFNYFIKNILSIPVLDTTNGFFAFDRTLLQTDNYKECFIGYGEFSFLFLHKLTIGKVITKDQVIEIPSEYKSRKYGSSKTKLFRVGLQYTMSALSIRIKNYKFN